MYGIDKGFSNRKKPRRLKVNPRANVPYLNKSNIYVAANNDVT